VPRELANRVEFVGLMWLRFPAAEIIIESPIENLGIDRPYDLRKAALGAGEYLERKSLLGLISRAQEAVCDWHVTEIDDRSQISRVAEAAMVRHDIRVYSSDWLQEIAGPAVRNDQ
jgi:hypothetical protein